MSEEKPIMNDFMIDIETLGNTSNSVIVSIGVVQFNINTGETGETFYHRVDIDSCLNAGLKVNGSTIRFWMDKSEEARVEISKGGSGILWVLNELRIWLTTFGFKSYQVWSRGVRFDIALLTDAYNLFNQQPPWPFRGERDVRTLEALRPQIYNDAIAAKRDQFAEHLAIADCLFQIGYCSKIWNAINP